MRSSARTRPFNSHARHGSCPLRPSAAVRSCSRRPAVEVRVANQYCDSLSGSISVGKVSSNSSGVWRGRASVAVASFPDGSASIAITTRQIRSGASVPYQARPEPGRRKDDEGGKTDQQGQSDEALAWHVRTGERNPPPVAISSSTSSTPAMNATAVARIARTPNIGPLDGKQHRQRHDDAEADHRSDGGVDRDRPRGRVVLGHAKHPVRARLNRQHERRAHGQTSSRRRA